MRDYLRRGLRRRTGLPFTTRFGDGEPVGADIVELINEVYAAHTRCASRGSAGDLLLVDNLRTAHSREALRGRREVLVAHGRPVRMVAAD